jgi:hypothetical protein
VPGPLARLRPLHPVLLDDLLLVQIEDAVPGADLLERRYALVEVVLLVRGQKLGADARLGLGHGGEEEADDVDALLPLDSYNSFIERIQTVTAEAVQRVAQKYSTPDQFTIVVVGDRSQIEVPMKALNEGRVEPRDLWGQPAK